MSLKNYEEKNIECAYEVCKDITKEYAKSFYFASHFLPIDKRKSIYAIYAFCRIADNIVDLRQYDSKEELEKLKQELKRAYEIDYSENYVIMAFVHTSKKYDIKLELANELIKGLEMDLQKNEYKNFLELKEYCYKVGSTPGLMLLKIIGGDKKKLKKYAIDLGIAMQLTNIIRDIKEDLERGKIYLPKNEMKKFNYSEFDLKSFKKNKNFDQLLDFEIKRAIKYYNKSKKGIKMLPKDSKLCISLCHVLYKNILNEVKLKKYDIFSQRIYVPTRKKIFLLFRTILAGV
ncbi:MAG: phytoene/squalene synthase family protein [Candidatus Diapherotrites archaeon]